MGQLSPGFSLPRVQEQGMIMILARVFVPTVATFLPQPRPKTQSCHHHCTHYAQPEVILCSDTGVLSPHTAFKKGDVVAGYFCKKGLFLK